MDYFFVQLGNTWGSLGITEKDLCFSDYKAALITHWHQQGCNIRKILTGLKPAEQWGHGCGRGEQHTAGPLWDQGCVTGNEDYHQQITRLYWSMEIPPKLPCGSDLWHTVLLHPSVVLQHFLSTWLYSQVRVGGENIYRNNKLGHRKLAYERWK